MVPERVLAAAREKYRRRQNIVWVGGWGGGMDSQLSSFPDMTAELAEERKTFTEVRRKLHAMDVRLTLANQVELHFTSKGTTTNLYSFNFIENIFTFWLPNQTDRNTEAFTRKQHDTLNKVLITLFEKKNNPLTLTQNPNIRVTTSY